MPYNPVKAFCDWLKKNPGEYKYAIDGRDKHITDIEILGVGNATVIDVTDIPMNTPWFERTYKIRIDEQHTMYVAALSVEPGTRRYDGNLADQHGVCTSFNPTSPVFEKIEAGLLIAIKNHCNKIIEIDTQFIQSNPRQCTDKSGNVWHRLSDV